jgi:hypothetical protein
MGRRLASRDLRGEVGREGEVTLCHADAFAPGIYFVRLRQGAARHTLRVALVP